MTKLITDKNKCEREKSMKKQIVLCGYGNVGYEFIRLLMEKKSYIQQKNNLELEIVSVSAKTASAASYPCCINMMELLECGRGSDGIREYAAKSGVKLMSGTVMSGDVFVDATSGVPGDTSSSDNVIKAINQGMDVVLISKGALTSSYKRIMELASLKKVKVKYSGAAAAALPTVDIGYYSLAGCKVKTIEGVLNGTSSYILSCMHDQKQDFTSALEQARKNGIAEPDSSKDIKGIDAACKLVILANSFMEGGLSMEDVKLKGIDGVTLEDIKSAEASGRKIRLLARAYQEDDGIKAEVCPREIGPESMLYCINGTEKGVIFETDIMGKVAVMGGASNPRAAAAAALKDIINIYR
jgi:homoserine dehydrogenase